MAWSGDTRDLKRTTASCSNHVITQDDRSGWWNISNMRDLERLYITKGYFNGYCDCNLQSCVSGRIWKWDNIPGKWRTTPVSFLIRSPIMLICRCYYFLNITLTACVSLKQSSTSLVRSLPLEPLLRIRLAIRKQRHGTSSWVCMQVHLEYPYPPASTRSRLFLYFVLLCFVAIWLCQEALVDLNDNES